MITAAATALALGIVIWLIVSRIRASARRRRMEPARLELAGDDASAPAAPTAPEILAPTRPASAHLVPAPAPAPRKSLPDTDAWEALAPGEQVDEIVIRTDARIRYVDSKDQHSERTISVLSCRPSSTGAIRAFCHGRQQNRTFLIARIREYIDAQTGEVVDDVPAHLRSLYLATPRGVADQLVSDHADAVAVLVYVLRCAPAATPKRKAALAEALIAQTAPDATTAAHVWTCIQDWTVARKTFETALQTLQRLPPPERSWIVEAAGRIAAASRKTDPLVDAAAAHVGATLG